MGKKVGRDILLLCLPIIFLGVGVAWTRWDAREPQFKATGIKRWSISNSDRPVNSYRIYLTLQWKRYWLDQSDISFKCQSWLLDADGKVVSEETGYALNPDGNSRHLWIYSPSLYDWSPLPQKAWKEPLTLQGMIKFQDLPPLKLNYLVPKPGQEDGPILPSPLPFADKVLLQNEKGRSLMAGR